MAVHALLAGPDDKQPLRVALRDCLSTCEGKLQRLRSVTTAASAFAVERHCRIGMAVGPTSCRHFTGRVTR